MKHLIKGLKILALVSLNVFIIGCVITFIWGDYDPSGRVLDGPVWLKYPMQYSLWGLSISLGLLFLYGFNKALTEEMFKPSRPPHENENLPDHQ